jgi:hypothetical protein
MCTELTCQICGRTPARFVCTGHKGLRWLTCGEHGPRKDLVTIEQWVNEHGPLEQNVLPPRKEEDGH